MEQLEASYNAGGSANGTVDLGNNLAVYCNVNHTFLLWPWSLASNIYLREIKTYIHKIAHKMHINIHNSFVCIAPNWNNANVCQHINRWTNCR